MLAAVPATIIAALVSLVTGWPSPLEAPAELLMQWTPVPLANVLLDRAGDLARPAALLGALALTMAVCGLAGALAKAFPRTSAGWLAGEALAGGLIAFVLFRVLPPSSLPGDLLFLVAFLVILSLLPMLPLAAPGRRAFLMRSGVILGGAAVLLTLFSIRPLLDALAVRRLFPYQRPRGLGIPGLADLVTPADRFYIMDKVLQYPDLVPGGWRLVLDGAVRDPLDLDLEALLGRRRNNRYLTMECVDNPVGGHLISNALWTGVSLAALLKEAGAEGDTLVFHAPDGYAESVPRAVAEAAGAMVAYGMNGESLPRAHGYPARIVLPGSYGFKSVKWLTAIEVLHGPHGGSWRAQGWTEGARIHTMTRIDVARREGERVLVAGVAFAGRRGVRDVQVRANAGPWRRATLGPYLSSECWVQWAVWLRGSGPVTIEARAIDGGGQVQEERRRGAYPDGATGWPSITV
ncbi:MAG: molybdopterin-dependent oxidoreductase [Chloroflexota bacterium]|nr:molybdopterin-dependent oxidoreductase [Chloroflexota bacterium]